MRGARIIMRIYNEMKSSGMKKIISTTAAPGAIGPYSQAVEANGTLYISGQVAIDPATGKMVEGGITEQTEQVLKNIRAILLAAGYTLSDVVKSTCLLSDMTDFKTMNEVYARYYSSDQPARAAFAVKGLPLGALIEIETIAVK
jgi:2-iminobutanoate/2-iminopropanoate deaminase